MARSKQDAIAPGKLYALEGIPQKALAACGRQLLKRLSKAKDAGGVSVWDASGIFHQLDQGGYDDGTPSPKTLLLLYATDLQFRLRWEILPLIAAGKDVVAAPYVSTAIAFAAACGISKAWTDELFSFAPKAEGNYRLSENVKAGKDASGFVTFAAKVLAGASDHWGKQELPRRVVEKLARFEDSAG